MTLAQVGFIFLTELFLLTGLQKKSLGYLFTTNHIFVQLSLSIFRIFIICTLSSFLLRNVPLFDEHIHLYGSYEKIILVMMRALPRFRLDFQLFPLPSLLSSFVLVHRKSSPLVHYSLILFIYPMQSLETRKIQTRTAQYM